MVERAGAEQPRDRAGIDCCGRLPLPPDAARISATPAASEPKKAYCWLTPRSLGFTGPEAITGSYADGSARGAGCSTCRVTEFALRRGRAARLERPAIKSAIMTLRFFASYTRKSFKEHYKYGKDNRNRPRHDELVHGGPGGWRADRHRERRGRSHDPFGRRDRASGERLVGTVAKRQAVTNPQNTIFSIKRFMGRKEAEVKRRRRSSPTRSSPDPTATLASKSPTGSTRRRRSPR